MGEEVYDVLELAQAEWGENAELMDPIEVGFFYRSYVRRKKFEAELIVAAIAVAMGGKTETPAAPSPTRRSAKATPEAMPDRQVVPAHQFFKILESR